MKARFFCTDRCRITVTGMDDRLTIEYEQFALDRIDQRRKVRIATTSRTRTAIEQGVAAEYPARQRNRTRLWTGDFAWKQ